MVSTEMDQLNFLEREYGIKEILRFFYYTSDKEYWDEVKEVIKKNDWDSLENRKEYYKGYHRCGCCKTVYFDSKITYCKKCGWGGYYLKLPPEEEKIRMRISIEYMKENHKNNLNDKSAVFGEFNGEYKGMSVLEYEEWLKKEGKI